MVSGNVTSGVSCEGMRSRPGATRRNIWGGGNGTTEHWAADVHTYTSCRVAQLANISVSVDRLKLAWPRTHSWSICSKSRMNKIKIKMNTNIVRLGLGGGVRGSDSGGGGGTHVMHGRSRMIMTLTPLQCRGGARRVFSPTRQKHCFHRA